MKGILDVCFVPVEGKYTCEKNEQSRSAWRLLVGFLTIGPTRPKRRPFQVGKIFEPLALLALHTPFRALNYFYVHSGPHLYSFGGMAQSHMLAISARKKGSGEHLPLPVTTSS